MRTEKRTVMNLKYLTENTGGHAKLREGESGVSEGLMDLFTPSQQTDAKVRTRERRRRKGAEI